MEDYTGSDVRMIREGKVVAMYDYRSRGIVCGYSQETQVYGGLTNVLGHRGVKSRGILMKKVLSSSENLGEALEILTDEVKKGEYGSANYVIGNFHGMYRVESFGEQLHISWDAKSHVVTNHFKHLKYGKRFKNSLYREKYVKHILRTKRKITRALLESIATHHEGATSICNHGRTLGSMIFAVSRDGYKPMFLYSIGTPCKGYKTFEV